MKINLNITDQFVDRHIGPEANEIKEMLATIGVESLDKLMDETIPQNIRLSGELNLPEAVSEYELLHQLRQIAQKNKIYKTFIGLGYYDTIVPPVIQRNILENPGWYTQYTPYQAEISQGRLEALLNFQTMIADLTGMEVANASLSLDEATAAAEAMFMLYRQKNKKKKVEANLCFVSQECFPQTIDVLKTRAEPMGIELVLGDAANFNFEGNFFGAIIQYPAADGAIYDYRDFIKKAHDAGAMVAVAADLLSLTLLTPPGELGADMVFGNSQNFGVPMGYGGPHAAFFAVQENLKRNMPGRIIGVSRDRLGNNAYRLALQTREQHIRREKATSNICTAQALLAIMAGMYGVYHGPEGLKNIARRIHTSAAVLERELQKLGLRQVNPAFFNTLKIHVPGKLDAVRKIALQNEINFRYINAEYVGISLDETVMSSDLQKICAIFAEAFAQSAPEIDLCSEINLRYPETLARQSPFLKHPVFHEYHTESKMMRYIKSLENKDLSLTRSMISLGSCTMKLNAAAELLPISWPEFSQLHPFIPTEQAEGYAQIFQELDVALAEITGFAATSFQPNSGAQGEYSGLMIIRAYHRDQGNPQRKIVLIPSSAHGTNPASGVMAGMEVVIVKCTESGDIDLDDVKAKATQYKDTLAALMITYPSTHGVFEEKVQEICAVIHANGGQVFMDGANMNAQVGLTNPGMIGADVCHLNLHKTFGIPHGGGGPGMGPICVAAHLAPYLPGHSVVKTGGPKAISAVSAAPWGSANILLISYAYIRMLGKNGLLKATHCAILNANYLKARLGQDYQLLYSGRNGRVAHEMIIDMRPFKPLAGITVEDIAKRLVDYGFHAPTMSFPVPETLMVEPTESESKDELDRFCDAMSTIRKEIQEVADGRIDKEDNPLKNAPHMADEAIQDNWSHPYSREVAVYPLPYISKNKFWPPVARIDNVYGDRHLVCTCPDVESYIE